MLRNKSLKNISTANLSSSRVQKPKPAFRTIYKRRNDTIPAIQLYEDLATSRSQTQLMTQSQILLRAGEQSQRKKQLDIREYVKKMGSKREIGQARMRLQFVNTEIKKEQHYRKTARQPLQSSQRLSESQLDENKAKKNIEELQHKIQSFVAQSISLFKIQKRNIGLSKWSQLKKSFSTDKQMEDISNYFNELRIQLYQNQNESQRLRDLDKKIQMLEKMLASECVESQMLKLQYYGWKNQKANTTSFSSKKLLKEASKLNKENKPLTLNRDHFQMMKQVSPLSSTANCSFKKPSKEFYLTRKQIKDTYSVNRQPLPRSSYSAQYLNYGHTLTYRHKPDTVRQSPQASLTIKNSSYQQQFKQKLTLVKKLDFKALDSFKNKFKNTNISFMNSSKKQASASNLNKKPKEHKEDQKNLQNTSLIISKNSSDANIACLMNLSSTKAFYKTEAQKQFNWRKSIVLKENEDPIKSEPKDKKLICLKENFKNLALKQ